MRASPDRTGVEAFRSLVASELGLRFEDDKLPFLEEVLAERVRLTGAKGTTAYLERVPLDPREPRALARALGVSETYFLRNRDHFRVLQGWARERANASRRSLEVLSAGCASGEEAYSVAIAILEVLPEPADWQISVLGIDLNPDSIDHARRGAYGRWSLRETPPAVRHRYFREEGERYTVEDSVRRLVRFECRNLIRGDAGLWRPGAYDVILCRNVLMYFTPEAARAVVGQMARSLRPGGHLFLGHAESLRDLDEGFLLQQAYDTFYYVRGPARGAGAARSGATEGSAWHEAIARSSSRIEELAAQTRDRRTRGPAEASTADAARERVLALLQQERFQEAGRAVEALPQAEPGGALLRAICWMGVGELERAREVCQPLLDAGDADASVHYLVGLCHEQLGDLGAGVAHYGAAVGLDPSFGLAHLQLGRAARRRGDRVTARRELGLAVELLPHESPTRIALFGGGFGRDAIVQLGRGELLACEERRS